ncbi:uncharacterized protein LOC129609244 [Condylostylus longicornis]|uniref:uncharacterized protein LOC129609244 n=1 Tax=Condylostylus longicornis TaxID=2530218 RepID=UPI00244E4CFE|nr:uncharacterized protein LOC129609244 [Condylostylus longicornis]
MLLFFIIFNFLFNYKFISCDSTISVDKKIPIILYDNSKFDENGICFSSLTQADCNKNEIITAKGTEFGCPACSSKGKQVRDVCGPFDDEKCQFGLICNTDDGVCDLDKSTCAYIYHLKNLREDEAKIDSSKLPTCEIDGTFAAVQCKGDRITGRCFCFSPEGKRIYGWAWWNELQDNQMNCACSLLKYKMERQGLHGNTMHCDKMGNFEELQCMDGMCWCADTLTGEIQNNTRAVPETMWKFLPCYDKKYHGDQYLRQCESIDRNQLILKKALAAHGTTLVEFNNIMCDYDGSYGPIRNLDGKINCQWTDGRNLPPYTAESKYFEKMNCICARDKKIFEEAGFNHRLNCDMYGNYKPDQHINDKTFCVDRDGFAVSGAIEVDPNTEIDCKIYTYYDIILKPEKEVSGENGNGYDDDSDYFKDTNEDYN